MIYDSASHQLEGAHFLQLGDDELAVHVVDLKFKGMDLNFVLLDLVFHGELLREDGAALIVELFDESSKGILIHFGYIRHVSNLCFDNVRDGHDVICAEYPGLCWTAAQTTGAPPLLTTSST